MNKQVGDEDSLRGRVTSERTGKAAPRLALAAVRLETLRAAEADAPAPPEAMVASEMDGSFSFDNIGALAGDGSVALFTLSPLYVLLAPTGEVVGPGVPSVGQLLAAWGEGIRPKEAATLELMVRPVCEHEPYTEMVPMSDGTPLATEIFLPDGEGPWPVVLTRTPYGRFAFHADAARAMEAAYAFVAQDHRGRYDSDGENIPFIGCGWEKYRDGYDTVEWIASQPWCNGKVATYGGSAMGITQYLMAPTAPPHLVCQVIVVGTPDLFAHADYPGGLLRKEQVVQWTTDCQFDEKALQLYLRHYYRDEWTERFNAAAPERVAQVRVPGLHIGGWYDIFNQGTVDGYWGRQHHGGEGARGTQRLIMGPWTHGAGLPQSGPMRPRPHDEPLSAPSTLTTV
ncbi:MAG: CocE/NonD family hydrolase, partial [Armatimonadetes bacterium]|nr:CocE/NonD family hydrolase [Armatimonadota bacterium]